MHTGPNIERDGLVFGYDTGYGIADNSTAPRFYPGEPTINGIMYPDFSSGVSPYSTHTVTVQDSSEAPTGKSLKIQLTGVNSSNRTQFSEESSFNTPQTAIMSVYAKGEGSSIGKYLQTYSGATWYRGIGPITSEYKRYSVTLTTGGGSGGPGNIGLQNGEVGQTFYIHSPQLEAKSHVTPFTDGTRSSTQSLIDLTKTTNIDTSNVSFDSTGQPTFDGTDDRINGTWPSSLDSDDNTTPRSWEVVFKTTSTSIQGVFGHKSSAGCSYYCNGGIFLYGGNVTFNWYDNSSYQFLSGGSITTNKYMHVVGTFDGSTGDAIPRIYVNGELKATYGSSTNLNYGSGMNIYDIGWNSKNGGLHYFNGEIPIVKYYKDKALSLSEIQQNYNAYKNRFNI